MSAGNTTMLIGAAVIVIGALIRFVPGAFTWFGNLPGDIRIENPGSRVFIPITSMIVVSAVLTGALWLIGLFRGR